MVGGSAEKTSLDSYSIPNEAANLLQKGLIQNPAVSKNLPLDVLELANKITFHGSRLPSIPINWRFAESVSTLKALESIFINALLKAKYDLEPQEIKINTDHAQLLILSTGLVITDPQGDAISASSAAQNPQHAKLMESYFPQEKWNIYRQGADLHRHHSTNIYRCRDGRFYHLHSSLNPEPTLTMLGLPSYRPGVDSWEEARSLFIETLAQYDSEEIERIANDEYKQCGTRCWSVDEYRNSDHGRANSNVGLWEIFAVENKRQKASWWLKSAQTSPQRPLAGLKVVDLTRIIAGPSITRGLAELGASVMRITAPHIPDNAQLHPDLNWGKWNAHLDLREEDDRATLRELIKEADVVVNGYRPGVLDKYGFSLKDIHDLCRYRERGLVVVRENCYGWHGPWRERSGWQQLSDANCGVSLEFGRAMGHDEPVTPVFPNSDYCTGLAGVAGTLDALIRRGKNGGSYTVDIALNYYSQWLVNSVGTYPADVWEDVWTKNGREVFRHYHTMTWMIPRCLRMVKQNSPHIFDNPEYMEDIENRVIGKTMRLVKPVLQFPKGGVILRFNVSTRTNGVDQPKWPLDLMTEVVS